MCAIRMPSQDIGNTNNETKDPEEISEEPAVLSLDIFIKLVTTLSSYGSKFNGMDFHSFKPNYSVFTLVADTFGHDIKNTG